MGVVTAHNDQMQIFYCACEFYSFSECEPDWQVTIALSMQPFHCGCLQMCIK